ncbi:MAG: hypothetical protein COB53_11445 [Elusimicrobia bacterium]|nr:MAG: hypothetical protein COB53_11445 [Elusimicrobiota bacterium]
MIARLALLLLLGACSSRPSGQAVFTGRTMGTTYTVKLTGIKLSSPEQASLHAAIENRLIDINDRMSTYIPTSELSRFNNHKKSASFPVSDETAFVVKAALEVARKTDGAFDPTVGPLVDLWGFGPEAAPERIPSAAQIKTALAWVGWSFLTVEESPWGLRKKNPRMRVDLSAIAKGYGVDSVAALLVARGIKNFMVEIGGEVFAAGRNARNTPWILGIETPRDHAVSGAALSATVAVDGKGLASSGGYRNFYMRGGKRYSHFIDPRSGRPITHRLAAVSVLAPSCMEADAAATAVMVLGEIAGQAFLDADPQLEGLLLIGDNSGKIRIVKTSGWPR